MSKKKGGFSELLYKTIMPKIYGIGGAVVIIGALFKILHLTGADTMLVIGLVTEAVIFFLSAFEPPHHEVDWSKVYPELSDEYVPTANQAKVTKAGAPAGASPTQVLDLALEKAKIGPELFESLGKGMNNLAESAKKMSNLSDAAVATNDYASNVKKASTQLLEMNKSYDIAIKAVSSMSEASKDAGEYHSQVQKVTKNLAALNSVYEMELKDADSHVKNMNKFYESLTGAMQGLTKVGDNTTKFTTELGKFSDNLAALNKVYGSMLTAMKGGGQA
jgi:gliding motility-associated protein GldL